MGNCGMSALGQKQTFHDIANVCLPHCFCGSFKGSMRERCLPLPSNTMTAFVIRVIVSDEPAGFGGLPTERGAGDEAQPLRRTLQAAVLG